MVKSNINITSNIYVRSTDDIIYDKKYTEKITGAERLKNIKKEYKGLKSIRLTEIQDKIVSESTLCMYAENGEKSYGPVKYKDGLRWVNRCEYTDCPGYESEPCTSNRDSEFIARRPVSKDDLEEEISLEERLKEFGITIQDDTVIFERDKNIAEVEIAPKEYSAPKEMNTSQIEQESIPYEKINTPDCIISAPLDSHIILNSGPGTGKTYTIIQRLIYILENFLCPADEICILCYTRSAKNVIESKIAQAIIDGILQPSAKNIYVLTFDSYATYFLMEIKDQGVINEDLSNYNYNERIRMFNKYISAEDFGAVSYFIVDEIQDLVNERAEMVLKILENLKCGYLLAGDRCQSIYDYEADDNATIDSVEFYKRAERLFPEDMRRYEITVNKRQAPNLAEKAKEMREKLLNAEITEQNKFASKVISDHLGKTKIEKYIKKELATAPTESTAILCRNNGEAEYISALLCEKGIIHTLNRGINNVAPLPRWIADVFWDYCKDTIGFKNFKERFKFRCNFDADVVMLWELLCKLAYPKYDDPRNKTEIDIPELRKALTLANNIPSEFYSEAPKLTVSTIHKAKGSEFEKVILIESNIKPSSDSAEEARIRYVALTRPKKEFVTMKKNTKYFKRIESGRVIETGLHNIYNTKNRFCKCIAVGFTGDIDNNSFVSGDFESALDLQEYIIHNIKIYDKLTAKLSPDAILYEIYHKDRHIGSLSKQFTSELDSGVASTDYKYNLPTTLEKLYVSGITTEILRQFNEDVPLEYQKSGICFGIQITGLAELKFEKK